jgi:hypothetical protein
MKKEKEPVFTDPLNQVKLPLAARRSTLHAWALSHGFIPSTVHCAVYRNHQGRLSIEIRRRLRKELGL